MATGAAEDVIGWDCTDATARLDGGAGSGHGCVHPALHASATATHPVRNAAADDRSRADARMCRSIAAHTAA